MGDKIQKVSEIIMKALAIATIGLIFGGVFLMINPWLEALLPEESKEPIYVKEVMPHGVMYTNIQGKQFFYNDNSQVWYMIQKKYETNK